MVQPNFGIRVKKLRLDKDLSQFELAEAVGLSEEQISNIERGKSWTGELSFALLADALGVSQQSLFDYSQNAEFVASGGLKRRATRKPAKLIVGRKRKVLVAISQKKN